VNKRRPRLCAQCRAGEACPFAGTRAECPRVERGWKFGGGETVQIDVERAVRVLREANCNESADLLADAKNAGLYTKLSGPPGDPPPAPGGLRLLPAPSPTLRRAVSVAPRDAAGAPSPGLRRVRLRAEAHREMDADLRGFLELLLRSWPTVPGGRPAPSLPQPRACSRTAGMSNQAHDPPGPSSAPPSSQDPPVFGQGQGGPFPPGPAPIPKTPEEDRGGCPHAR